MAKLNNTATPGTGETENRVNVWKLTMVNPCDSNTINVKLKVDPILGSTSNSDLVWRFPYNTTDMDTSVKRATYEV